METVPTVETKTATQVGGVATPVTAKVGADGTTALVTPVTVPVKIKLVLGKAVVAFAEMESPTGLRTTVVEVVEVVAPTTL